MKTILYVAVLIALGGRSMPASAQDAPKIEAFGGYSLLVDESAIHGWQASLAVNPHRKIGLLADVATQYSNQVRFHQFLFGPQFNGRIGRTNPFVHGLVGFESASGDGATDTNLALGLGGGIDVKISGPVSIRPLQFDWIPIKTSSWNTSTLRFGIGLVIGFGD
jgi:hypothetical protein